MQIQIDGIPVTIVKKNIKHLHLTVRAPAGEVFVSAPKRMPKEVILLFVREKIGWIRKQQEKIASHPRPGKHQYISGETIFVWGRPYTLEVTHDGRRNSLVLTESTAILNVRRESTKEQREAYLNEWYRLQLKEAVTILLPKWEGITDLHPSGWQSKNMATRWGTCNTSTKKIWLSLQLAKKPVECLEYVILHELAHLVIPDHGADFAAILDRYMPIWREVKNRLNESPS